jgi:hypothetical protein
MPCADALSQKKREPLRRSANRRIVVKQLMVPKSSDSVLSSDPACYSFRGWSEWSFDFPRARSGAASIALFARTRRRSSACRGTSTTKTSPFASEKFKSATVGLSREIRVSADLASTRCSCLCGAIRVPLPGHWTTYNLRPDSPWLSATRSARQHLSRPPSHFAQTPPDFLEVARIERAVHLLNPTMSYFRSTVSSLASRAT